MKKPVRIALLAVVPSLLITGGVLFAMPDPVTPQAKQPASQTLEEIAEVTASDGTSTIQHSPTPVTPENTVSPTPVPPASTPAPAYGEDPSNPGVFKVFDTNAVMNRAGIAEGDKQYVMKIVTRWIYNDPTGRLNLCHVTPPEKMKIIADDYMTNPVTQLKWCNGYITARYGTWENSAKFLATHHYF